MFESLDFIYMPSRDVAGDARYFTTVLGGELVFAIDAMGTRVAMVALSDSPPRTILADHVDGDAPILVFRVANIEETLAELESRGWKRHGRLELPMGPACSFRTPGGQRIAVYEPTRPGVVESFAGRRDFEI
ncbi:MAG TPA: hypothetical protein VEX62_01520 [Candidatus Limnocylindrales bacterium]|nr:hypothetical protein [Candidatus Limnocylindrales bacterium]